MPIYFWAFAVALLVAMVVMPAVILLAQRTGAMDAPNARKVHKINPANRRDEDIIPCRNF